MTRSLAARAAVVVHILLLALIAALLPTQVASANPDDPVGAPPIVEPTATEPVDETESVDGPDPVDEPAGPADDAPVDPEPLDTATVSTSAPVQAARTASVPSVTVTPTTGLEPGDTVTVTGTGFAPEDHPGALGTRPPLPGDYPGVYVAIGTFLESWRPSEGAPSSARAADASQTKWFVLADQVAIVGAARGGVALDADGSFEVTFTVPDGFTGALEDGRLGVYTYAGSGAVYAPFETETLLQLAAPGAPSVTVTPSSGLRVGDTVTVTGTGFAPEDHPGVVGTRPPLPGDFAGVYVAIGTFLESWRPSEGAPSSARAADASQTKWFVRADQVAIVGAARGGVALDADGSFEVAFTVPDGFTGALEDGRLGVYTYAGSGAVYAPFETETLLQLAQPTLEVSQVSDLDPDGAELTITGRDYDARSVALYPPGNTNAAGVYLQIGWLDETWRPSEGAPSSARSNAESRWVQGVQETAPYLKWTEHADGTADFEWTVTITKAQLDAVARAGATLAVFTIGAGGVTQPANELAVPIAFATPNAPQEPQQPQEPGAEATPGSLLWGIKASFRDYVTGPIAHGSISVAGGAGVEGGRYWFPQASGGLDAETGLGSVAYRGSVRFSGHGGQLSVVVGDPIITITDAGRASLSAVGAGGRVTLATLQLSAGSRTVDATGAVTYSAVPATLTGAGAVAFAGFYNAGAALDPVSFTVGAANSASGVGGVVAAAARETAANTPAPTPPAINGITISGDLVAGGEITATASGFEPDETGILVVIYSDPVVLATDAAADASGTVTWTGRLPAGLTGEHTLTFQGSVDRGAVLDIAAAEVVGCEVAGAELEWGFKEEFRAYIDGSIANGEWTTADGATYETPLFRWEAGTGGYDAEAEAGDLTFTGSVRFTGHGGILDTTIANPRVVIGGDEGVLLLDVTGTTRDGEPVSAEGVEFAELDLGAAERVGGGDLIAFVDIPATLTTAGSAAFGTYEPRSALDPITLQITTSSDCGLPAVVEDAHPEPEPEPVAQGFPWVWILVAIGVLLVLAVIAVLALRSRRA